MGYAIFWGRNMNTNNVRSFVDEYILLCTQLCKKADDYTKENVAKHNKAMKKLNVLRKEMYNDIQFAERVYKALLYHPEVYVQQSAATDCLRLNIHTNDSVKILKNICKQGDRMSSMSAKRTLLIWEGKLNPNDPF